MKETTTTEISREGATAGSLLHDLINELKLWEDIKRPYIIKDVRVFSERTLRQRIQPDTFIKWANTNKKAPGDRDRDPSDFDVVEVDGVGWVADLYMTGDYYGTYDGYATFSPRGAGWFARPGKRSKSPVQIITEIAQIRTDLGIKLKTNSKRKKEERKRK
jgi:hypothetical protein